MTTYRAPGVYYQTVDAGDLPVTPLRTDIAGFVGIAERGPIDLPIPIRSWRQFASWFGSFSPSGFLAYAVRAFFENGGRRCWVVRVAGAGAASCASASVFSASEPVWSLRAASEGVWGNNLAAKLRERNAAQTTSTSTSLDGRFSLVSSVGELGRATLVKITQDGSPAPIWRVISEVDATQGAIYWEHPSPEYRLPYDRPLAGLDPNKPALIQSVDYTLIVEESNRLIRLYDRLSLIPEHPNYGPGVLPEVALIPDSLQGQNAPNAPEPIVIEELRPNLTSIGGLVIDPQQRLRLTGGLDGLSTLSVYDFVGEPLAQDDSVRAAAAKRRGLRALEEISEVSLLAIPDAQIRPIELNPVAPSQPCVPDPCIANPPQDPEPLPASVPDQPPIFGKEQVFRIQSEMVLQSEMKRDRFALLDSPFEASQGDLAGIREVSDWRARFETKYGALHFSWIKVLDPLREDSGATRLIPPCGHVAGCISRTDLRVGVHKAPANVDLAWALDSGIELTEEQHGLLNSIGINAILGQGSRGHRIMGARTLSSDPDWRYINVRRLVSMIEKALEVALQWAVFEPNDILTRARATMSVTFFLLGLHESGALAGATPEESFFVKCDLENNPAASRDLGQLIVEVGVAPSKPFEFIVLRVGRVKEAIEVTEAVGNFGLAGVGV